MSDPFSQSLIFLMKLAWESRYRIPLIITVSLMALDIRMQLDVNVQMRRIRRARPPAAPTANQPVEQPNNGTDDSSDSWLTVDEEEVEDGDIGIVIPETDGVR
ncbi:hypothetical protein Trydic_g7585 [Trypoxylus dichotomus]